ncbi:hypothetical protein ACOMHN_041296 [Nucella lapillus]
MKATSIFRKISRQLRHLRQLGHDDCGQFYQTVPHNDVKSIKLDRHPDINRTTDDVEEQEEQEDDHDAPVP